jgi:hypothetical protein
MRSKPNGFANAQLLIAIAVGAVLLLGGFIALRKYLEVFRTEGSSADIHERSREVQGYIRRDLQTAFKINGFSKATVQPFRREFTNNVDTSLSISTQQYNDADASDPLTIYREIYGEFSGGGYVLEQSPVDSTVANLFYIKTSSAEDDFFRHAFENKSYFFLVNAGTRNVLQKSGSATLSEIDCPHDATRQCYSIPVLKTAGWKLEQLDNSSSTLRVGEKVTYVVSLDANGENQLYRMVDDHMDSARALSTMKKLVVYYQFAPDPKTNHFMPSTVIRSPLDSAYHYQLVAAGQSSTNTVDFADAELVQLDFSLPATANLQTQSTDASKPNDIISEDGISVLKTSAKMRPGKLSIERSVNPEKIAVQDLDPSCSDVKSAQCNAACAIVFNDDDPNSAYWKGYGDIHSDACICKKFSDGSIRDPSDGSSAWDWALPSWQATGGNTQLEACARWLNCSGSAEFIPICFLANRCFNAKVWGPAGFDYAAASAAMAAGAANNYKISCRGENFQMARTCDGYARLVFNNSTIHVWENNCKCRTQDRDIAGNPLGNSMDTMDGQSMLFDRVCSKGAGGTAYCGTTWDPAANGGTGAYIVQDAAHPDGLSWNMAALCACRTAIPTGWGFGGGGYVGQGLYSGIATDFASGAPGAETNNATPGLWAQYMLTTSHIDLRAPRASFVAANPNAPLHTFAIPSMWVNGCGGTNNFGAMSTSVVVANHCLSTTPLVVPVPRVQAGTYTNVTEDCSKVRIQMGLFKRSKDKCLPSNYPAGTYPSGYPHAALQAAGVEALWWDYRYFCHPDCGNFDDAFYPDPDPTNQYADEVNAVRLWIQAAVGDPSVCTGRDVSTIVPCKATMGGGDCQ